jgi:hypothetical protein
MRRNRHFLPPGIASTRTAAIAINGKYWVHAEEEETRIGEGVAVGGAVGGNIVNGADTRGAGPGDRLGAVPAAVFCGIFAGPLQSPNMQLGEVQSIAFSV